MTPTDPQPHRARPTSVGKSPALYLLGSTFAYFALWLLVPKATFLPKAVNAILTAMPFAKGELALVLNLLCMIMLSAPTVAFMAIQISIVYHFAKLKPDFKWGVISLAISLGSAAAITALIVRNVVVKHPLILAKLGHYPNVQEHLCILSHYPGLLRMPVTVLTMLAAASVGCLVALRIRDRNLLLPVVMFAAVIDLWTVTRGPVSALMRSAPDVGHAVSAPIPQIGTGAFMPNTFVGPGDSLFMALVFAAVCRLKMNGPRNYWFVFIAMTIGMLAVMSGLLDSLPALIVLAAAVVSANWREFHLSKQEKASIAVVAIVLLTSLPLVWHILKPHEEKKTSPKPSAPVSSPALRPPRK